MSGIGNQLKTVLLMSLLTVLVILAGGALGGRGGMQMAFLFAMVMNFGSYWFSDKMALAMTKAVPLSREQSPELYETVENLADNAGLPMPRLYMTPSPQPNAFATGRNPNHAAIAVTQGLMQILNREELEGVLAHEMAHIKNRDILISTLAAVMAGVLTMLANWAQWALMFGGLGGDDDEGGSGLAMLPMIILGPLAAMLVQMGISRSREYLADSTGSEIAGNSYGLANALQKLERSSQVIPMNVNPSASHMFIVNPLKAKRVANLFSTHPPIEERVKRLYDMERR
ncbi:Heat shock protein [Desulfitobacterium dichloroeliminans LMG P-21439]|uniref:Protease HtpX homolog n=1 Tax=Desulfitobacterium dichloroeliminans (strain LMG P-21439 / DCA1) TaxID=871963 RepID=L0FAM2_DESDL|nr:zinc metalloprotease HtpX [Desulfitobacterium dichloroeliminans]AGA69706.1 Heat shock protein [Desulfitobacterium dichloroeliminans LMG P-21439]